MGFVREIAELFGYSPDDIRRAVRVVLRRRFQLASLPFTAKGFNRAVLAARDPLLTDFLEAEYPDIPLLKCNGSTFPVILYPLDPPVPVTTSSSLIIFDRAWTPAPTAMGRAFYWIQRSLTDNENRPTFVLKAISTTPLAITCGLADFFSVLRTSQALEWELHQAVGWAIESKCRDYSLIKQRLKLRRKLLDGLPAPWTNGNGRAAAIGLSVLLAYREGKEIHLFLRRRGPLSIAYNRDKWHVFPSGMFQAPYKDYDTEFSILHACLWEFLEELFDVPDPSHRRADPKWFYSQQPVKELLGMINDGRARLFCSGVAVNLASMRPEILLTLFVDDDGWFARHQQGSGDAAAFTFSKELASAADSPSYMELVQRPRLESDPSKVFQTCGLTAASTVPAGAAALYQGIRALNAMVEPNNRFQPTP